MHTTASDGRLTPAELVARAAAAGLTIIGVTDHDTVAAIDEVTRRGAARTACASCPASRSRRSHDGRDVHMLGYFIRSSTTRALGAFLDSQRGAARGARARDRPAPRVANGVPIDVDGAARARAADARDRRSAARSWRARWCAPVMWRRCRRRSIAGSARASRPSCRAPGRRRPTSSRSSTPAAASRRSRIRA